MAFSISPAVTVSEIDLTAIVPAVSTTDAAIAGVFSWGPIDYRKLVTSETDLINQYQKPTSDNYETWYSASNFLSYSNKLYVTRAASANVTNAVASNGSVTNLLVKNEDDYTIKRPTLNANSIVIAKYAGSLGNSLKVSICDSSNAFSSNVSLASSGANTSTVFTVNSNTAVVTITSANSSVANTDVTTLISAINVGDLILAGNSTIGTQQLKVSAISAGSTANNISTVNISFSGRYVLSANTTLTSIQRYWEYSNVVNGAPGTSPYVAGRGGSGDEIHIVVIDQNGKFSGTPGNVLEVFNNVSRATDSLGVEGGSIFWKNKLNNSSLYLWAGAAIPGTTENVASAITPIATKPKAYLLSGGVDSLSESAIPVSDLARAYDQYKSAEDINVSIILTGKSVGGLNGEGLANYITDNIVEVRKDCVQVISPALEDVVNRPYQEVDNVVEFRNSLRSTSYAILDSGYKYQYDRYNDVYRWIPLNADIAGAMARTDELRDPWWSPAGYNRGIIKNVVKLAFNPNKAQRDILYKNGINPVMSEAGAGTVLFGDKTLQNAASAFDRINVRRLFIVLEKAISTAAKQTLFEFNDAFTRAQFRNLIQPYLRDIQGRRGITDFKVICDESNNTGQVIDSNQFIGDIYIKAARSINFIQLNFVAVRTDVEFTEVIGQF